LASVKPPPGRVLEGLFMSTRTENPDETLWVMNRDQIRLAKSPRRHDIVDRLAASGPLSIRELAEMLGAQPPALYHHMRQLVEGGIVVEAGHRTVRRKREQLYDTVSRRIRLGAALEDPANDDLMTEIVGGLTRQMDRDFRNGLGSADRDVAGPTRNLGFLRVVSTPSPQTLEKVNAKLEQIADLLWRDQAGDNNAPVVFHWLMAPLTPPPGESGEGQ